MEKVDADDVVKEVKSALDSLTGYSEDAQLDLSSQ